LRETSSKIVSPAAKRSNYLVFSLGLWMSSQTLGAVSLASEVVLWTVCPMRVGSVYVHFPYCLTKCPYCDFVSYKTAPEAINHAEYADAVLRELERRSSEYHCEVQSIFFGGGTPSLWDPRELGRVLRGIRSAFSVGPDVEVSMEANPTSLRAEHLEILADAGVNRLSIGVQSLDPKELAYLGREHHPEGALAALKQALDSPIARVSGDLIFGLPEQSTADACAHALRLVDLGLRHLSCYQLTIESGTRFGELAKLGRLPLADDGRVAEAFLAIDVALEARGLSHYEISNYAAPGEQARHNLSYWRGHEYLGLGCGAFGFLRSHGAAVRYRNQIDPKRYLTEPAALQVENLDPLALLRERIMLGLRLRDGFDLAAAGSDLGIDPFTKERQRALAQLVDMGRLKRRGTHLTIPMRAWLFADDTAARLF
jgi:putative oxygen-independent coproporphyrinogen III oxidase